MALILKKPNEKNKGIIILTHKEGKVEPHFRKWRKHYLIGTHIGWDFSNNTEILKRTKPDFYLSSFSHLTNDIPKDMVIELNARNFLPNHFDYNKKDKNTLLEAIDVMNKSSSTKISEDLINEIKESNNENIWDIIWVNRPSTIKKPKSFLDNVKKLFENYGDKSNRFILKSQKLNLIMLKRFRKLVKKLKNMLPVPSNMY